MRAGAAASTSSGVALSLAIFVAGLVLTLGCSATTSRQHLAAGAPPLCGSATDGQDLGRVAVIPEAAWRADQKQRAERLAMAARAVAAAFAGAGCLEQVDVRPFAGWASRTESDRLAALAAEGIDTAIFLRLEELGPVLEVTLSLPFLWFGASETTVQLRAVHIPTERVLLDVRVDRSTGGPFQLRPAGWAEAELQAALEALLQD